MDFKKSKSMMGIYASGTEFLEPGVPAGSCTEGS